MPPELSGMEADGGIRSASELDTILEDPLGRNWRPVRRAGREMPSWIRRARVWRVLRWTVGLPLAILAVLFLVTTLGRMAYPFELEWIEGQMALQADRLARGLPLYVSPDSGWVPFSEPPLYFWTVSWFFRVFGFSLFWGRLVSWLSTLAAAAGAAMIVYDRTRKRVPAAVAGLMLFAFFEPAGFWFDLFRADVLALALMAWGAYFSLKRRRRTWQVLLGVGLLGLAPLARQSVAAVTLAVYAVLAFRHWRASRYVVLILLVAVINGAAVYGWMSEGKRERLEWTARYLVLMPKERWAFWNRVHPEGISPRNVWEQFLESPSEFTKEYLRKFGEKPPEIRDALYRHLRLPLGLLVVWLVFCVGRRRRPRGGLWLVLAGLLVWRSVIGWVRYGGFLNEFIPAFWAAGVVTGLSYGGILHSLPRRWMRGVADVGMLGLLCLTFLVSSHGGEKDGEKSGHPYLYAPASQWPAESGEERGKELLAWIRGQEAGVRIPHHEYLIRMSGGQPGYNMEALRDLANSKIPVPGDFLEDLTTGRDRFVVVDWPPESEWMPEEVKQILKQRYRVVNFPVASYAAEDLLPVTGAPMKPRVLLEFRGP